jgi:hypothetical protein
MRSYNSVLTKLDLHAEVACLRMLRTCGGNPIIEEGDRLSCMFGSPPAESATPLIPAGTCPKAAARLCLRCREEAAVDSRAAPGELWR